MTIEKLPKRTRILWQLRCFAIKVIMVLILMYFGPSYLFFLYTSVFLSIIGIGAIVWYIPCFIKSYRIYCTNDSVVIKRGVIIKTTHIMPYSRLIYTQTYTTPIAKLFGLQALSLKAARTGVLIPEMAKSDAEKLSNLLSKEKLK